MKIEIGESFKTPFANEVGVYQDGTVPLYRDVDGRLWGMSGHSHMGHIGMFCGTTLKDMRYVYEAKTDFEVGTAGTAFAGIKYPEGVLARGSIWPFGLYICPGTHRFFCYFHNETGWNGKGTAYDALGPCEQPRFDSDFRHVGMMHSDDEGRTWTFDRWVLTGEAVCFTEKYIPESINAKGQTGDVVNLGSGDFSCFFDAEFLYLFYDVIHVDVKKGEWLSCDVYVARTRLRRDGIMGDFVKYYDGSFSEAGNLGKESVIVRSGWHPRVIFDTARNRYLMCYNLFDRTLVEKFGLTEHMVVSEGKSLTEWGEPLALRDRDGHFFGNHYNAIVSADAFGQPCECAGTVCIMTGHNGTDVTGYDAEICG